MQVQDNFARLSIRAAYLREPINNLELHAVFGNGEGGDNAATPTGRARSL
jgi:hypothetical protein